jgi:hypothetical protein
LVGLILWDWLAAGLFGWLLLFFVGLDGLVGCVGWLVVSVVCWLINWLGCLFPTAQQTKKPTTQQPNNQ